MVSASFCKSSSEAPRGIAKRTNRFPEPFEVSLFDFCGVFGTLSERFDDDAIVWLLFCQIAELESEGGLPIPAAYASNTRQAMTLPPVHVLMGFPCPQEAAELLRAMADGLKSRKSNLRHV